MSIVEETERLGGVASSRSEGSQAGRAGYRRALMERRGWVSD